MVATDSPHLITLQLQRVSSFSLFYCAFHVVFPFYWHKTHRPLFYHCHCHYFSTGKISGCNRIGTDSTLQRKIWGKWGNLAKLGLERELWLYFSLYPGSFILLQPNQFLLYMETCYLSFTIILTSSNSYKLTTIKQMSSTNLLLLDVLNLLEW